MSCSAQTFGFKSLGRGGGGVGGGRFWRPENHCSLVPLLSKITGSVATAPQAAATTTAAATTAAATTPGGLWDLWF